MGTVTSNYERDPLDFYVEQPWCVDALLNRELFTGLCYDPACGIGTIPLALVRSGLACAYGDLVARPGLGHIVERDFLKEDIVGPVLDNIICNPPYSKGKAEAFILRALVVANVKVAMLLQLSFLASQERKRDIFDPHPPARVYVFSRRPSMPPGQMLIDNPGYVGKGGSRDYCWIVWDKEDHGPTRMGWLA